MTLDSCDMSDLFHGDRSDLQFLGGLYEIKGNLLELWLREN